MHPGILRSEKWRIESIYLNNTIFYYIILYNNIIFFSNCSFLIPEKRKKQIETRPTLEVRSNEVSKFLEIEG